jgi:hypothetical protein
LLKFPDRLPGGMFDIASLLSFAKKNFFPV